jgi:D-serine deaminase-like pyridoxal phosphate-dependent protein
MPLAPLLDHQVGPATVKLPDVTSYRLADEGRLVTPALLVYPDAVSANISTMLGLVHGDPGRWRAHIKSAKLPSVIRQLIAAGVAFLKCATTLELRVALECGARNVLLAYPIVGPKVARVADLARGFSSATVSALVDTPDAVTAWKGVPVGLFIDINPGMDRTGIPDTAADAVVATARAIADAGIAFGGLHYYDGHILASAGEGARESAHRGYARLLDLVATLGRVGIPVPEIITAGTPGLPCSLSYAPFRSATVVHRVSPGTIVYTDATTAGILPADWSLRPAAVVAATVVSHPAPGRITCDAGHKTVSADAGVPTCAVLGRPDLTPLAPSEEHLSIAVPPGRPAPAVGEILYLVPRHVCPTVNNFDEAVIVRNGRAAEVERVAARGHESPLVQP